MLSKMITFIKVFIFLRIVSVRVVIFPVLLKV